MPAPTPQITLNVTLKDIKAGGAEAGSIEILLCGFGNDVPRVPSAGVFARTDALDIDADPAGTISTTLFGNDVIEPADTYYTIAIKDSNGDIVQVSAYRFTGNAQTVNLSDAIPIDPDAPAFVGIYVVPLACANPVFDNNKGTGQSLTLTRDVPGSSATNFVTGAAVPFIIKQDGVGGRAFAWPASFQTPPAINLLPNGVTTSMWYLAPDGNFYQFGTAVFI
jgi:hypothetical protein